MTLWSPDTCGCQIEIADDGESVINHAKRCSRHVKGTIDDSHDVFAENRMKNVVAADVKRRLPDLLIGFGFDPDGTLNLTPDPAISADDRATLSGIISRYAKSRIS